MAYLELDNLNISFNQGYTKNFYINFVIDFVFSNSIVHNNTG